MPTGTVSGGSNASRTFPIRDDRREETHDSPAANESTARTDGRGGAPPTLEEEVAHLRKENEDLRRTLRETREQRQDVIDRYEQLIDADADDGAAPSSEVATSASVEATSSPGASSRARPSPPRASPAPTKPITERVAEELDAQWTRLRRRYKEWQRQSGL